VRRGAPDRGEYRQAAGAGAQRLKRCVRRLSRRQDARVTNKPPLFHDCSMTLFVWDRTSNKQKSYIKQQTKNKQMPLLLIEVLRQTK
jgi:hypothetical protein